MCVCVCVRKRVCVCLNKREKGRERETKRVFFWEEFHPYVMRNIDMCALV